MGVRIYGVQAGSNNYSRKFFKEMTNITHGRHLQLDQFSNICDMIMAICYRERGADFLEAYEDEVRGRHGGGAISKDLEGLFGTLRDDSDSSSSTPVKTGTKKGIPKATALKKLKAVVKAKGAAKKVKGAGKTKPKAKPARKKTGAKKTTKTKTKAKKSKKFLRENVNDKNFIFGSNDDGCEDALLIDMEWTDWKRAIYPAKTKLHSPSRSARGTKRTFRGANGYVRSDLFKWNHDVQAIYELGVRPPGGYRKRIYATLFKFSKGFKSNQAWDSFLLRNKRAFEAVSNVIAREGLIFVRRAVYPPDNDIWFPDTIKRIKEIFDYAWNKPLKGGENFRTIEKGSFLISGVRKARNTPKKKTATTSKGKSSSKKTKAAAVKKSKPKTITTKKTAKKTKPTKKTKGKGKAAK